jgi:hypothetical protein
VLVIGEREVPLALTLPWLLAIPTFFLATAIVSSPARVALTRGSGGRLRKAMADAVRGAVLVRAIALRPRSHLAPLSGGCL